MELFRDTETGEEITRNQLEAEYQELKAAEETEAETFSDYLDNCLHGNGFLERV